MPQKVFGGLAPTFSSGCISFQSSALLFSFHPKPLVEDFTPRSFFSIPGCWNAFSPPHTGLISLYIKHCTSVLFGCSSGKNRELTRMNILPASFYLILLFNLWRYIVSTTVVSRDSERLSHLLKVSWLLAELGLKTRFSLILKLILLPLLYYSLKRENVFLSKEMQEQCYSVLEEVLF